MANPTCPTNCSQNLPALVFDLCAPKRFSSELKRIFIANATAASFTASFSDETPANVTALVAEWNTRLNQSTTGVNVIRTLNVTGSMPAASAQEATTEWRKTFVVTKDRTINFSFTDISTENYAFLRSLECGGTYKVWFETWGGIMFGGNDGIKMTLDPNHTLNAGLADIETAEVTGKWKSKFLPERSKSPIFTED